MSSADPAASAPARVVTTPALEMARITLFDMSATYITPVEEIAMPCGEPKRAFVPVASV